MTGGAFPALVPLPGTPAVAAGAGHGARVGALVAGAGVDPGAGVSALVAGGGVGPGAGVGALVAGAGVDPGAGVGALVAGGGVDPGAGWSALVAGAGVDPGAGVGALVAGVLVVLAVLVLPPRREAAGRRAVPGSDGDASSDGSHDREGGRGEPRTDRRTNRRIEPAPDQVASALALLALGYRSGLPTWDVLDAVGDGLPADPAADLRQVAAALRWGASDAEAWGSVGAAWSPAARAVEVAHLAGVPPAPLLLAAADDLREAELERVEVAAARIGVRLVAPLGVVLLPAFCLTTVVPLVIALARDLVSP